MNVGKIQAIGTGQICVYPLNDHKFGYFSDIFLERKIFSLAM
jgi:hypothetical protein